MRISKGMLTVNAIILVLSCTLFVNSASAATYVNQDYPVQGYETYTASIRTNNSQVMPVSIEQVYDTDGNATNRAIATYAFGLDQMISFPAAMSSAEAYYAGYLNGVMRYEVNATSSYQNVNSGYYRMWIENNLRSDDNVTATCYQQYMQSGTYTWRFAVVWNNFSLPNSNMQRHVDLGSITVYVQCMIDNTADAPQVTWNPTISVSTSTPLQYSPMAVAGQSIAGQVYSAIENSIQVADIVNYLSLIEDIGGDLNVAVSHIDNTLIPQVIQHLINISTNTGVMRVDLDEIVKLLTAFMNTWPQYESQVLFYLNQLVNMNAEQSSAAAAVEQEYNQKASAGSNLNEGMQIVIPSVDQEIFDIDSGVDASTMQTLSAFWSMFTGNTIIQTMFVIAIAGIAAGFLLYGKKGG